MSQKKIEEVGLMTFGAIGSESKAGQSCWVMSFDAETLEFKIKFEPKWWGAGGDVQVLIPVDGNSVPMTRREADVRQFCDRLQKLGAWAPGDPAKPLPF